MSANGNIIKGIQFIVCPDGYYFAIKLVTPKPLSTDVPIRFDFAAYVDLEKKRLIGNGTKGMKRYLWLNHAMFDVMPEPVPFGKYIGNGHAYFLKIPVTLDIGLNPNNFSIKTPKEGFYSMLLIVKGDFFPEGYELKMEGWAEPKDKKDYKW